jgi:hypothetical protein
MKTRFLFPYYFKFVGLALIVIVHFPLMHFLQLLHVHFDDNDTSLFNHHHVFFILTYVMIVIGLLMVAFSKEKVEDEHISQLRLDSLQWALYLNYLILIITLVFTNGIDTIDVLRLNLWVPLVFFIIRFRWVLYRLNRSLN